MVLHHLDLSEGTSLVPRPFPAPVFDRLQYAKMEGKAWEKVMCMTPCRHEVNMMGAVSDHCNSQTLHCSVLNLPNNELYWRCLSNVTALSFWTRYYKKDLKILHQAPPPSCPPSHLTFLHTASYHKLEVGTAWERGYESTIWITS